MTDLSTVKVLFVCTANICRSPTAELLGRQRFGDAEIKFRSAGFLAEGQRCPAKLIDVLAERGIDASHHRSYKLDLASLNAADIILTMEAAHVQKATILNRPAFGKVFPLAEIARMVQGNRFDSLDELLAAANEGRDPLAYMETRWDVVDPYGKSSGAYRRTAEEISSFLDDIAESFMRFSAEREAWVEPIS